MPPISVRFISCSQTFVRLTYKAFLPKRTDEKPNIDLNSWCYWWKGSWLDRHVFLHDVLYWTESLKHTLWKKKLYFLARLAAKSKQGGTVHVQCIGTLWTDKLLEDTWKGTLKQRLCHQSARPFDMAFAVFWSHFYLHSESWIFLA